MRAYNRSRPTTRLRLESLEDRSVPSTFTVNTTLDDVTPANGKLSLREAIARANTTAGADLIVIPAGVFKITQSGAGEDANLTGDFDISDSLTIQGAGSGFTIIDGKQLDRVFDILGTGTSSIRDVPQGMTICNGNVTGDGGGIRVGNADLVVRDCVVTGNRASLDGGGISNGAAIGTGNVTLVRTTVGRNVAGVSGGGGSVVGSSLLTIKNSLVRRNVATGGVGGGINATTATLTDSTVIGNFAVNSACGGISATTAMLTNCTISGNTAGTNSGGILASTATLTNCTISGNLARTSGGGIGATTATLTNCTISGNTAGTSGGGMQAIRPTLNNCTVRGNSAGTGGGGILAPTPTLTNSTVSGNSAGTVGGGIRASEATLTNCTVSGNSASGSGGGINANTASLFNCTIAENIAHTGGGIFHLSSGGPFIVKNTIVALNLVDFNGTNADVSGDPFTSQGHNLIGDGTGGTGFTDSINGDMVGTSLDPIDPKLGPLASNGGRTKTHALLAGSLAIDHGDNAGVPPTDQRGFGFARKKDGNGDGLAIVDIGAFER